MDGQAYLVALIGEIVAAHANEFTPPDESARDSHVLFLLGVAKHFPLPGRERVVGKAAHACYCQMLAVRVDRTQLARFKKEKENCSKLPLQKVVLN